MGYILLFGGINIWFECVIEIGKRETKGKIDKKKRCVFGEKGTVREKGKKNIHMFSLNTGNLV